MKLVRDSDRRSNARAQLLWLLPLLAACAETGGRGQVDESGVEAPRDASEPDAPDAAAVDDAAPPLDRDASAMDSATVTDARSGEAGTSGLDGAGPDAALPSACGGACAPGLRCDSALAMCCPCSLGESECLPSIGNQRVCSATRSGCGAWSEYVPCGATGCASDMKRCQGEPGVQVDQWGQGQVDEVRALSLSASGELLLAGYSNGALDGQTALGDFDLFVSARTPDGAPRWTRLAGTTSYDSADGVLGDAMGNIFVAGQTNGKLGASQPGARDAYLTKLRADRSVEWTTQWGSPGAERVTDLARDVAGNLLVAGWTTGDLGGANAGMYDMFVSKLSAAGAVLWSVQRGTSADDLAIQLATDGDGNAFVVGSSGGALSGSDAALGASDLVLIKISASGSVQWIRQWGSSSDDGGLDVACLSGGDLLVSGYTRGSLPGATGTGGGLITRLDANGAPRWARLLGKATSDGANRLTVRDDVVYTTGVTDADAVLGAHKGLRDIFVDARRLDGMPLWTKQVGTDQNDESLAIAVATNGTVYVAGTTSGSFAGFSLQGLWDNLLVTIRP